MEKATRLLPIMPVARLLRWGAEAEVGVKMNASALSPGEGKEFGYPEQFPWPMRMGVIAARVIGERRRNEMRRCRIIAMMTIPMRFEYGDLERTIRFRERKHLFLYLFLGIELPGCIQRSPANDSELAN